MGVEVSFLDELYLKKLRGQGRLYEVSRPFRSLIKMPLGNNTVATVPVGFVTDFASVPRLFWRLLPPVGNYDEAAVLHDYLYVTQVYTRLLSDQIFKAGMIELKVKKWKRNIMYRAVRMGGWMPWQKHREES